MSLLAIFVIQFFTFGHANWFRDTLPGPFAQVVGYASSCFLTPLALILVCIMAAVEDQTLRQELAAELAKDRCLVCDYPNTGLPSDGCPECGTPRQPAPTLANERSAS